jgi:predicted  nucleic acid-binding Zn-ribbon protein
MIHPLAALLRLHEINVETARTHQPLNREEVSRLMQALTPAMIERYRVLYREYGEDAVAPVRRGACTGCHTRTPAKMPRLDDEIYECERCGRILYIPAIAYEMYVG